MEMGSEGSGLGIKSPEEERFGTAELHGLLASLPATIFCVGMEKDLRTFYVNATVTAHLGYTPGEITGDINFWTTHIHPDDIFPLRGDYESLLARGSATFEYRFLHKNGTYRWMRGRASVRLLDNMPCMIAGYFIDVTEDKEREGEISEFLNLLYATEAEHSSDADIVCICAGCKKVRDTKGNWTPVEEYIGDIFQINFTHGICTECVSRLYGTISRGHP